jgi:Ca-activated chloride channel family protein
MRPSIFLAAIAAAALPAFGQGVMLPAEQNAGPVALKSHRVQVVIDNHVAETRVEQVFVNNAASALPVEYLFPLPKNAAVTGFDLVINGKAVKGQVEEKAAARAQYMKLVGRTGNAGLLDYLNHGLMRVSLGNIEPGQDQKIEIRYTQVLSLERGLAAYELPLKTTAAAAATTGDFTVGVKIKSPVALGSVYSPSHTIKVNRPNAHEASFGFEKDRAVLDRDLRVYYSVTEKEFGLNLVTHRPDPAKPGYFLCLIAPKSEVNTAKIIKRDVIFVLDVSGSMRGKKLEQAKEALKFCVNRLNAGDKFTLIEFDSNVLPYSEELLDADPQNVAKALAHIDGIQVRGGTNINDALLKACSIKREAGRPGMVVFLTDGLPSAGERNPDAIARNVLAKAEGLKIFSFGVGYDVNTRLLDGVSEQTGAAADYVRPDEDIEVKVGQFYSKASRPVLANLKLEIAGADAKILDIYPRKLPDMFAGGQIAVFGRYEGHGPVGVKLSGDAAGKAETFAYEAALPAKDADHKFVEPLWAQRKIGYLLDALRQKEDDELKNEVIRLSKAYGIQTPYTAYAAMEKMNEVAAAHNRRNGAAPGRAAFGGQGGGAGLGVPADGKGAPGLDPRARGEGGVPPAKPGAGPAPAPSAPTSGAAAAPAQDDAAGKQREALDRLAAGAESRKADKDFLEQRGQSEKKAKQAEELQRALGNFRADAGRDAVNNAAYLRRLKEAENAGGPGAADLRQVGNATYFRYGGLWVDDRFAPDAEVTKIKFGSDAYFALLSAKPELAETFKLGNALVLVTAAGKAVVIGAEGEETLTDARIAALFVDAPEKEEKKDEGKTGEGKAEDKK